MKRIALTLLSPIALTFASLPAQAQSRTTAEQAYLFEFVSRLSKLGSPDATYFLTDDGLQNMAVQAGYAACTAFGHGYTISMLIDNASGPGSTIGSIGQTIASSNAAALYLCPEYRGLVEQEKQPAFPHPRGAGGG